MSLDKALADMIAALDRNTAAHSGAVTPIKPARAKPAAETSAPAVAAVVAAPVAQVAAPATARVATADTAATVAPAQIKAAGDDLSTLAELDRATAVAILSEFGVQKMTAMPPSNIPEFHNKVKAAIARLSPAQTPSLI